MGKDRTVEIERNYGAQRYWFARFCRKSIVVSKSREMVDITMAIFAAVHVKKHTHWILSLVNALKKRVLVAPLVIEALDSGER